MLRGLITFGLGVYTGVYLAQNYEIQKVDDPQTLLVKLKDYLDELAKESGGSKK